jgi:RNase adapter protein RapZ
VDEPPIAAEATTSEGETAATPTELVVITGMSGAGRSEAIHTFEDLGYFCIDNLPPAFLSQLVDLAGLPGSRIPRVAVVCDMRSMSFFDTLLDELDRLEATGHPFRILYLEAAEKVLVNRFKTTRRRHPLAETGSITDGIRRETLGLAKVRERADLIIDTSDLLPQQLRTVIRQKLFAENLQDSLVVTVASFGFKYGPPIDADIVMDVRFLPNPYYIPKLRHRTGQDRAVRDFVLRRDETAGFLGRWKPLLDMLLPAYLSEGKHHLAIAMGCTGGMHRSVVLAEETARHLRDEGYSVSVRHRDINKDREWL